MFGLKSVWRGQVKVSVSDSTRTILDMLSNPGVGGGIRSTADMFKNYLKSENKNLDMLIDYSIRLGNGAVFQRLGFLLERFSPDDKIIIEKCKSQLTKGTTKFDPKLGTDKLVTRWKLWIPKNWVKEQ